MSSESDRQPGPSSKAPLQHVELPQERIMRAIHLVHGHKVLLDADLAILYEVETKVLNQAVRRNIDRFPDDFAFRLSDEEFAILRSQTVTSSWGGRRYPPYAFTEQGVADALAVLRTACEKPVVSLARFLRSTRAVSVNIEIMRTFVQLRRTLASHEDLARKLTALEKRYDQQFAVVFEAIRQLMAPEPRTPRIGFGAEEVKQ